MITPEQFREMQVRLNMGQKVIILEPKPSTAVKREMALHDEISAWCNGQWPRWKFIRHRSDQKSGIQVGAQDFTIFGPFPLCVLVECKSATGKLSEDQQIWAAEMKALGWTVHVVRSMEEFKTLVIVTMK